MQNIFIPIYNNFKDNENRGGHLPPPKKKKLDFKSLKCNTIQSLNDVEYFLNNMDKFAKGIKLYKLIKKC